MTQQSSMSTRACGCQPQAERKPMREFPGLHRARIAPKLRLDRLRRYDVARACERAGAVGQALRHGGQTLVCRQSISGWHVRIPFSAQGAGLLPWWRWAVERRRRCVRANVWSTATGRRNVPGERLRNSAIVSATERPWLREPTYVETPEGAGSTSEHTSRSSLL